MTTDQEWIAYDGSGRPVDRDAVVFIRCRDGYESAIALEAKSFYWRHDHDHTDIIAYRVVKESAEQHPDPLVVGVTVPCCGYLHKGANYPVYWNSHNGVVQCHNCGQVWKPVTPTATEITAYGITVPKSETAVSGDQHYFLDLYKRLEESHPDLPKKNIGYVISRAERVKDDLEEELSATKQENAAMQEDIPRLLNSIDGEVKLRLEAEREIAELRKRMDEAGAKLPKMPIWASVYMYGGIVKGVRFSKMQSLHNTATAIIARQKARIAEIESKNTIHRYTVSYKSFDNIVREVPMRFVPRDCIADSPTQANPSPIRIVVVGDVTAVENGGGFFESSISAARQLEVKETK